MNLKRKRKKKRKRMRWKKSRLQLLFSGLLLLELRFARIPLPRKSPAEHRFVRILRLT
jgi:hypothetical protein